MKKIAFFGGSGGLGQEVIKYLNDYEIDSVSSKMVNLLSENDISNYFYINNDVDVLIIFSNFNYNSFIHKYDESNYQQLEKQININITGVIKCISSALKIMRRKKFGRIILASSVTVDKNVMGTGIYAATKSFYENIVKTISLENASYGITCNCIQLGYMDGGLTYTLSESFINDIINSIPNKRLGSPEEISQTIEFLIKNEYINGTTIKLTGGL
jgi:NAD(P)-dependent dehydrogenase (short-subunit alcohol dehydrogenase family)